MSEEEIFLRASRAILDAKNIIEKAEAALRDSAKFERDNGLTTEAVDHFLNHHLSLSEREQLESHVQEKLREIHEAAEQAVSEHKKGRLKIRPGKIKMHV